MSINFSPSQNSRICIFTNMLTSTKSQHYPICLVVLSCANMHLCNNKMNGHKVLKSRRILVNINKVAKQQWKHSKLLQTVSSIVYKNKQLPRRTMHAENSKYSYPKVHMYICICICVQFHKLHQQWIDEKKCGCVASAVGAVVLPKLKFIPPMYAYLSTQHTNSYELPSSNEAVNFPKRT